MAFQTSFSRKTPYAPHLEKYVKEVLPTVTTRKAARRTDAVADHTFASHYIGSAGSVGLLIKWRFYANAEALCALVDRDGTIDYIYLESAGEQLDLGDPYRPVATLKGTVKWILHGSYAAGTYGMSAEIYKEFKEVV